MKAVVLLLGLVALVGCASPSPACRTLVLVPVPVACREPVPDRPAMPTEMLLPGAHPWVLLRAALAEIDRREGYEVQLRAALVACMAPVTLLDSSSIEPGGQQRAKHR